MPKGGYSPGSGRPKGSTNTLGGVRADVVRLCKEKNYDPIKELIDIAQSDDPMVPLDVKVNIHKELLNYMAPKLKSIDMEKRGTETINVMIQNFGELKTVEQPITLAQEPAKPIDLMPVE